MVPHEGEGYLIPGKFWGEAGGGGEWALLIYGNISKKIGPVNMAQANVTIFLVEFLIQPILDQECNPNGRQIAMPLAHQLEFLP